MPSYFIKAVTVVGVTLGPLPNRQPLLAYSAVEAGGQFGVILSF
jgi:hypothetical protein